MESVPTEPEEPSSTVPQEEKDAQPELVLPLRSSFKDPSWMTTNIRKDKKVAIILHTDVQASAVPVTTTEGYEFLCSYSWKRSNRPTIYVPGTPPKWNPPLLPKQLAKDKGLHWVDQHGEQAKRFQFEPIFQSLAIMNANVRFDDVDIVVNRNTLQKLCDFASFKRNQQFYVDLDMVGKTMFISRRERKARMWARGGYGRNFENEFTSEDDDLAGVDGHHRVIKYNMGDLTIVVRIEADGYYDDDEQSETSNESSAPVEFFLNFLQTTEPASAAITHHNPQHTAVISQGKLVPHNQTLELKSNREKNQAREQIWFGRTRHAIFGKHKDGLISAVEKVRWKQDDFEAYAAKNQKRLRRLVWFLGEVRRVVVEKTSGAAVLVEVETGAPLQIFEAERSYGALPREVIDRFWDGEVGL